MALLAACRPQEAEKPPDEVTVQLKWLHQSQFAGFYAADQNGYYAAEGLDVSFLEGGPDVDLLAPVVDGTAQFGIDGADVLIAARAEGKPVRAVATIYRRSPLAFVARADSGITQPKDLVGQNILTSPSGTLALRAMMARVGIGPDQYIVEYRSKDVALFASGEFPVWGVYLTGSIYLLKDAGYELNIIYPDDYGVHFYADTIFATDDFIAANAELVLRFLRATLKGWTYAVENSDAVGSMVLQYNSDADAEVETVKMEASLPLIHTGQDQIAWMRAEVWQGMHDILLEQGILDEPLDMDKVYTMEFLHEIYGGE